MAKNTELQARNHHVALYRNPPLSAEDAELVELGDLDVDELEHVASATVGGWVVRCENCGHRWEPAISRSGEPRGDWWLCANGCNLSERVANKIVRRAREGQAPDSPELVDACIAYLRGHNTPKRRETFENVERDRTDVAVEGLLRSHEWRERHREWTSEHDEAFRDFE